MITPFKNFYNNLYYRKNLSVSAQVLMCVYKQIRDNSNVIPQLFVVNVLTFIKFCVSKI